MSFDVSDDLQELARMVRQRVRSQRAPMSPEEEEPHMGEPTASDVSIAEVAEAAKNRFEALRGQAEPATAAAAVVSKTRPTAPYDWILVIDFECTCDESAFEWPHEIIEFPVVAVDVQRQTIVAEFHTYVKPVRNPVLTPFCIDLTGIRQEQVDAAPTLPEAISAFEAWLSTAVPTGTRVIVATDGPWDMRNFMYRCSVVRDRIAFPQLFYHWLDVRKSYASFFKCRPLNLGQMLSRLGWTFEGRPHSGLDDARNIARIAIALLRRGCLFPRVSHIDEGDGEPLVAPEGIDLNEVLHVNKRQRRR
jgi:inhibitor of KinA sporulation pathway (predicted exonuclease)